MYQFYLKNLFYIYVSTNCTPRISRGTACQGHCIAMSQPLRGWRCVGVKLENKALVPKKKWGT
jgi:hypothetical protein